MDQSYSRIDMERRKINRTIYFLMAIALIVLLVTHVVVIQQYREVKTMNKAMIEYINAQSARTCP